MCKNAVQRYAFSATWQAFSALFAPKSKKIAPIHDFLCKKFRGFGRFSLLCGANVLKTNHNDMKLYLGIILAIIGALLLVISYFTGLVDYNGVQFFCALLIIAGIVTHIYVNYKKPQYDAVAE